MTAPHITPIGEHIPDFRVTAEERAALLARPLGIFTPPAYLLRLMQRDKINWNWKINPEQKLSIQVADMLRVATLEGRYKGVWHAVPNEGKRHKIVALIMKAMGLLPGVLDFSFKGLWGNGCIELKAGKNGLTDNQKDFIQWCDAEGVKHALCRTVEQVESTLKDWGALSCP